MGKLPENREAEVDHDDEMTIMCWKDEHGHVVELRIAFNPRRPTARVAL